MTAHGARSVSLVAVMGSRASESVRGSLEVPTFHPQKCEFELLLQKHFILFQRKVKKKQQKNLTVKHINPTANWLFRSIIAKQQGENALCGQK